MELIGNSSYFLRDSRFLIQIGLNASIEYAPVVRILPRECAQTNGLTLEANDFTEFLTLAETVIIPNNQRTAAGVDKQIAIECTEILEDAKKEMTNFKVIIFHRYNILRFCRKRSSSEEFSTEDHNTVFDVTFDMYAEIFNLRITFQYKLFHLQCYSIYARNTHERIIKYFISLYLKDETIIKNVASDNLETFRAFLFK